jgi:hypothetical protein
MPKTGSEPTQSPIQWVEGSPPQGMKQTGRENEPSPTSSAEVKEV